MVIKERGSVYAKHNLTKAGVLVLLYDRARLGLRGLSLSELASEVPFTYNCLKSSLGKWTRWKLITRMAARLESGKLVYIYSIGAGGRWFVDNMKPEAFSMVVKIINKSHTEKP